MCSGSPRSRGRRPEHASFLELRLGLGTRPSRNSVRLPATNNTTPELWRELLDVADQYRVVERVPVVASLRTCGCVGVAGPQTAADPLAFSLALQLVGLHSPAEVVVAAVMSAHGKDRWASLKWLPHTMSEFTPLAADHLAASTPSIAKLIAELEDLVEQRASQHREPDSHQSPPFS